ncbi:MAG: class I SAM-dependent methyltransferase, partial [Chitinophagaceae bacterium]
MIKERVLEKNSRSAITWGAGGRDYDKISHSISDAIEHCVNRLAPAAGEKILDVATGTGWAARLLANRKAQVTGIDIGYELIAAAEAITLQEGLKINFEVGDAESLAFADENFDAVVS